MKMEYHIDIEYTDGEVGKHLTYRFENAELRNTVYQSICSELVDEQVDMNYLRNFGGVTVSTYNYRELSMGEIAQMVPNKSFRIETLNKILELVESKNI